MRRYNLAIACARTSKGCHYGIPATRDEIKYWGLGVFSVVLCNLPAETFQGAVNVLASWAEQLNATRANAEDDALFVSLDDLRRVAVERPELMAVVQAVEVIEAPPADPTTPKVVSCNKHTDCDAADARARAQGEERGAVHCNDDCCEDCFGS
jgi:hypothetical protein